MKGGVRRVRKENHFMAAKGIFARAAALLFPPRCVFCGKLIPAGEAACSDCTGHLPRVPERVCAVCGHEPPDCRCRGHRPDYDSCAAVFYYDGPVKCGIWRLKFGKKTAGTAALGGYIADTVRARFGAAGLDAVACVPMSEAEERMRGFNQSELLARAAAKVLGLPYEELLTKEKDTKPQRECSAAERRKNVRGAFAVRRRDRTAGQVILLVDDVLTTGNTLEECALTLRRAGAAGVYCAALAMAR